MDYNGVEREEDFYFNMTKAEVAELEASENGGFSTVIQRIIDEKDSKNIVKIFKTLVLDSYGKKSDDGKRFVKNPEIREEFSQTEAYVEVFMELATDAKAAAAFINAVLPKAPQEQRPLPFPIKE